jgi:hypothetical protein
MKLRAEQIGRMLYATQFRITYLPIAYLKTQKVKYTTIYVILPLVCIVVTQYLPLQEIHELKWSENRVKMKIFKPERESYRAGKKTA